ncbi:MAG: response regulator [Candidatus Alcyoniella australis]|nr:response regulator [Candidatus Alcyoniella australis]
MDRQHSKLILVIDDNEENVDIIVNKLHHVGYEVISAEDGEGGVELARGRNPGLILLDIMLPKMDGWEVLEQLKSHEQTKDIPVIFMTAYTTIHFEGERRRAIDSGATDYLKKPFELQKLAELVGRHLPL